MILFFFLKKYFGKFLFEFFVEEMGGFYPRKMNSLTLHLHLKVTFCLNSEYHRNPNLHFLDSKCVLLCLALHPLPSPGQLSPGHDGSPKVPLSTLRVVR